MSAGATGRRLEQNHPVLQQRAGASSQQSVYTQTQGCTDEKRKTPTQLMNCVHLRDAGIMRDLRRPAAILQRGLPTSHLQIHLFEKKKDFFWCVSQVFLKSSSGRELSLKSLFFSQMCLKDTQFTDFALHFGLSVVCLLFKASLGLHVHFCCVFTFCAVLIDVIYFFIIVKASGVFSSNGHL